MQHHFTTLTTAALLDDLAAAIDAIRWTTARDNAPWMRALDRAWDYILQTDTLAYDLSAHAIRVESATTPGAFYEANGDCACAAFTKGAGVCWHRAAARLVRRALEHQAERELNALSAELYDDARAAGAGWYDAEIAEAGARGRLEGLERFAAAWDADAVEMQCAALGTRIGAAHARTLAQAA